MTCANFEHFVGVPLCSNWILEFFHSPNYRPRSHLTSHGKWNKTENSGRRDLSPTAHLLYATARFRQRCDTWVTKMARLSPRLRKLNVMEHAIYTNHRIRRWLFTVIFEKHRKAKTKCEIIQNSPGLNIMWTQNGISGNLRHQNDHY